MYIGTLIEDLFQAVERAEKAAATLSRAAKAPKTPGEAVLVGVGLSADQYQNQDSETE
jgi:hypothetical protein